ncbi:hypothetical protein C8Q77DRAFT_1134354 [Trametes polyzona]|nr:hypothetical protein C8Q77DRAFT_1134354 [Trametes polyzona]
MLHDIFRSATGRSESMCERLGSISGCELVRKLKRSSGYTGAPDTATGGNRLVRLTDGGHKPASRTCR